MTNVKRIERSERSLWNRKNKSVS